MDNDRYKKLFFITFTLLVMIIIISCTIIIKNNEKGNSINELSGKTTDIKNNSAELNIKENETIEEKVEDTVEQEQLNSIIEQKEKTIQEEDLTQTDGQVIDYLKEKKDEISSKISDGTYKEKAKSIFVEIVDFIFYDGEIKNHTFKELKSKTKIEVMKIAIQIENIIEEYHPGLIDNIGGKYKNIKSKIINAYSDKVDEFCYENDKLCSQVKEEYNNIKSSLKSTLNSVKDKLSNLYQNKFKNN